MITTRNGISLTFYLEGLVSCKNIFLHSRLAGIFSRRFGLHYFLFASPPSPMAKQLVGNF